MAGQVLYDPREFRSKFYPIIRGVDFPTQWFFVGTLLNESCVDPSIFRFDNKWWMFTCPTSSERSTLRLYYADELMGPWTEHPDSPIIEGDANLARPGGRVLVFDGRIIRYAQDDEPTYGNAVRAFEITELTTTRYEEKGVNPDPILIPRKPGLGRTGWNAKGMHHIDPYQIDKNKWIACVDGYRQKLVFGLWY
jgi:hypothetical protein